MTQRQIWINLGGLAAILCLCAVWYWTGTGIRAIPSLTRSLQDQNPKTRASAAQGLAELSHLAKSATPTLLDLALNDPSQHVATEAARALARIDLSAARKVLAAYQPQLQDQDAQVRLTACTMLAALGPAATPSVPALLPLLDDPDDQVRERAVNALALVGFPAGLVSPALTRALEDKSAIVRHTATRHLAFTIYPPPDSWPILRRLTDDQDKSVASLAKIALGRGLGEPPPKADAYAQMIGMKAGADYALLQLARMGPDAAGAVPAIASMLGSDQVLSRFLAVEALRAIGPAAASAVPALQQTLQDEDPVMREIAAEALTSIGSRATP